jgi:hypothetical protein
LSRATSGDGRGAGRGSSVSVDLTAVIPAAGTAFRLWVVRLKGRFVAGGRPGDPELVGSEGYYIVDDASGVAIGRGFKIDAAAPPTPETPLIVLGEW